MQTAWYTFSVHHFNFSTPSQFMPCLLGKIGQFWLKKYSFKQFSKTLVILIDQWRFAELPASYWTRLGFADKWGQPISTNASSCFRIWKWISFYIWNLLAMTIICWQQLEFANTKQWILWMTLMNTKYTHEQTQPLPLTALPILWICRDHQII